MFCSLQIIFLFEEFLLTLVRPFKQEQLFVKNISLILKYDRGGMSYMYLCPQDGDSVPIMY